MFYLLCISKNLVIIQLSDKLEYKKTVLDSSQSSERVVSITCLFWYRHLAGVLFYPRLCHASWNAWRFILCNIIHTLYNSIYIDLTVFYLLLCSIYGLFLIHRLFLSPMQDLLWSVVDGARVEAKNKAKKSTLQRGARNS